MAPEKMKIDLHVKVAPEKFFEVYCNKISDIPNISSVKVLEILVDGEMCEQGSIILWKYVDDENQLMAKELVEAVDRENNSITYKVIEGDLLKLFKCFKFCLHVTPSKEYGGSMVQWIMEYEKLRDDVPDPHTLMYVLIEVTKDVEHYLHR